MTARPPRRPVAPPPDSDDQEAVAARVGRRLAEVEALSGIGSWEWDLRTGELHWSEQLCRVYGVEPDATPITYEQSLRHVHPDDREDVSATVRHAFETGGSFLTEHRAVHPDGATRIISGRGFVLLDEDGTPTGMLGSAQDVTEERAASARQSAEERRHAAGMARDDALALLDHDLRSPLSVIVGYVQLLERQADKGMPEPERLIPYLERIEVAARQNDVAHG